jgi:hypothetical protein
MRSGVFLASRMTRFLKSPTCLWELYGGTFSRSAHARTALSSVAASGDGRWHSSRSRMVCQRPLGFMPSFSHGPPGTTGYTSPKENSILLR